MARSPQQQGRHSRQKGARLERSFRRRLEDNTDSTFRRTQALGEKQRGRIGDVECVDGDWPFFAECRNREGWSLDQVIQGKGPVWKWWGECQTKLDGLEPILVFTRNRVPTYILVSTEGFTWWCEQFGTPSVYMRFSGTDSRLFILEI